MTLLGVEGLGKEFGGIHAVEDLSFSVSPGHIHSIIGPNGAGKTTLFNLITGIYVPSSGRIRFRDEDIAGRRGFELAGLGISRSFQNLQIFFNMTALENVMVGRHLHIRRGLLASLLHFPGLVESDRRCEARARELMDYVGLGQWLDAEADAMPYGALKRLEIARALASEPALLLLDEPAAGCNEQETAEITDLIRRIAADGTTVLLVEHDMKLVMGISDHIVVLDYGRKLAEGRAEQVRENPEVIAAYLGAGALSGGED